MNECTVTLRPITPDDETFLYRLYASTRKEELAPLDWQEAQKETFLRMQFTAQHTFYTEQFPQAAFQLLVLGDEPIGRLYVDHRPDEIRILDIALLPAYRNRGIGTRLIVEILDRGAAAGLPVRMHVEQYNPALRLYHRLGFRRIDDSGIHLLIEWSPG